MRFDRGFLPVKADPTSKPEYPGDFPPPSHSNDFNKLWQPAEKFTCCHFSSSLRSAPRLHCKLFLNNSNAFLLCRPEIRAKYMETVRAYISAKQTYVPRRIRLNTPVNDQSLASPAKVQGTLRSLRGPTKEQVQESDKSPTNTTCANRGKSNWHEPTPLPRALRVGCVWGTDSRRALFWSEYSAQGWGNHENRRPCLHTRARD